MAGIEDSEELRSIMCKNVFMVGPYYLDNHRIPEIPEAIRNAKLKNEKT